MQCIEDLLTPEEHESLYGRRRDTSLLKQIMRNVTQNADEALKLVKYRYTSFSVKEVEGRPRLVVSQPEMVDYDIKELAMRLGRLVNDLDSTVGLLYCAEHLGRRYGKMYSESFLYKTSAFLDALSRDNCEVLKEAFISDLRSVNRYVESCKEGGDKNMTIKPILDRKIIDLAAQVEKYSLMESQLHY